MPPRSASHRRGADSLVSLGMGAGGGDTGTRDLSPEMQACAYTQLQDSQGPRASVWAPWGPWIPGQQTFLDRLFNS